MKSWRVGDVTISCIYEKHIEPEVLLAVLPAATPDAILPLQWLFPHFADESGQMRGNVQAFVIDAPSQRIVVDTCIGNDKDLDVIMPVWSRLQGRFLNNLSDAGFPIDSIDTVLCTHLHADHIGWNTRLIDGKWAPTFTRARYLFARTELTESLALADPSTAFRQSVQPVLDAGLAYTVDDDHIICEEVSLFQTPGHTKGHVSVHIASQGQTAIISGDFMHHPCQFSHPEWSSAFDYNADMAEATRRRVLNSVADGKTLFIGSHFSGPVAGHVLPQDSGFRFEFFES